MEIIDKIAWLHVVDGRVLFLRSKDRQVFYLPGGKREGVETDVQALRREIHEELSVDIVLNSVQFMNVFTAQAHGKPEGVMLRLSCYAADYEGVLKTNGEIEEMIWLTSRDSVRTTVAGQLVLAWLLERGYIQ